MMLQVHKEKDFKLYVTSPSSPPPLQSSGATPVHIAATLVQSSVLDTICNKVGSEVLDIQDALGLTALMHACISGSEECVKFILKKKVHNIYTMRRVDWMQFDTF